MVKWTYLSDDTGSCSRDLIGPSIGVCAGGRRQSLQFGGRFVHGEPVELGYGPALRSRGPAFRLGHERHMRETRAEVRAVRACAFQPGCGHVHVHAPRTVDLNRVFSNYVAESWNSYKKKKPLNKCLIYTWTRRGWLSIEITVRHEFETILRVPIFVNRMPEWAFIELCMMVVLNRLKVWILIVNGEHAGN